MNNKKELWIRILLLLFVIVAVFLIIGSGRYASVILGMIVIVVFGLCLVESYAIKLDLSDLEKNVDSKEHSILMRQEILRLKSEREMFREKKEMEAKYKEIQLKTLVNQINPHFLYNTLESIRGQALSVDDFIVADMTETLSRFFRYCITQKGVVVTLEEEVRNINLYLKIINFRMAGKFNFKYMIENESVLEYHVPKLIIQPVIENALNHGIYNVKTGGLISLRILDRENSIQIYVGDNGVGIPTEKLALINEKLALNKEDSSERTGGIALGNINKRIRILFGDNYGVHVYSTIDVGTTVMISVPKVK